MKACFQLGGRTVCVPIQVNPFPIILVDPVKLGQPDPFPAVNVPWIESSTIPVEIVNDLSVLASINELAKSLKTPILQENFAQSMSEMVNSLDLPAEINISFDENIVG
jgi:hypothetical protein